MYQLDPEIERNGEINIVPMIDVVFSILAFFIIASLFLTRAEGIDVKLPQAATTQPQKSQSLMITIDAQGQIFLDGRPVTTRELRPKIMMLRDNQSSLVLIVQADTKVEHGVVVSVMDELRQIKDAQLAIATRKSSQP